MSITVPPAIPPGAMADRLQPRIPIDAELALRPWQPVDAPAVLDAFSDPDIIRWHTRQMTTIAEADDWIESQRSAWTDERSASFAIVDVADEAVLGRAALHTDLVDGVAEIAYWVLPTARRRHVASRAAIAATTWGHGFGFHRIELQHSTRNTASCLVADRAGFTVEGVKRQSDRHADGPHDMHLHARLATDAWPDPANRPPAP